MSAGTNGTGMTTTSTALEGVQSTASDFTADQLRLIKDTIAVGATTDELRLFVATARRMGLDPFARQIFAVKRWNSDLRREVMSTQVSIDGYRLVADRTGEYVPGPEPTFTYDDKGNLISATATVMKWRHGEWHPVVATARWDEYVQTKKDGAPTNMWRSKPHVMLGKCAEALALRKAFPAELAGTHVEEEMMQADNEDADAPARAKSISELKAINTHQAALVSAPADTTISTTATPVTPATVPNGEVATARGKSSNGSEDALSEERRQAYGAPSKEEEREPGDDREEDAPNSDGPEPPMGALDGEQPAQKPEDESQDTVGEWSKVADVLIEKLNAAKARPHMTNIKKKHAAEWDGVKLNAPDAFQRLITAWNEAGDRIDREVAAKPPKSKD